MDTPQRASRECILPLPPSRGGAHGAWPFVAWVHGAASVDPREQGWPLRTGGSPTYGAWPPTGGPDGTPYIGGGGRVIANLLVLVSFTSKFTNILGLIGW